ncbi:Clp protease N-terminal domain-containing protein [Gordonia sp. 852002-51296_SCH5728562-b]|uniref:Clp protease N-terminal domain-containing protein n=1 Tax=Gordonia sp. 852002-51296_SCH5728562-b TaxID=1834101 RepID=UPI0007EAC344|nr:Clp protease N-terminal domain-containing protein [Gordonia sp. 852002-51296_SCH5728562-b]OBA30852.1 Clp protease [Gordonia sp. 852002-51296_SCH5728562-b]
MFGRFSRDDKMMLAFATQEAADLGHHQLGNDHLILGMLCNARSPLFGLLGEQGLKLDAARDVVRVYHEENDADDEKAAEQSAADRYEEDREALKSIGIDLDNVRAAVRDRFGDDLSEGWAERGRGPRGRDCGPRGGGPRGRGRGHGHGRGHGRGRGRGFGPGFDPREGFGPGFDPREGFGPRRGGNGGFPGGPFGEGGPFGPEGRFGAGGPYGAEGPWEPGRGRRGPRGRGGRPRFAAETRDAFRAAVEIARERNDQLRAEYLLLGILEVNDPASRAVVESATGAEDLRAAVLASLPEVDAEV